jgi:hypothetical protein
MEGGTNIKKRHRFTIKGGDLNRIGGISLGDNLPCPHIENLQDRLL